MNYRELIFLGFGAASILQASIANAEQRASYKVEVPQEVKRGQIAKLKLVFSVKPPWYIYAPTGANAASGMVETRLALSLPESVEILGVTYPPYVPKGSFQVFQGDNIEIIAKIRVRPGAALGEYKGIGVLRYQVCKSDTCLPPSRDRLRVAFSVVA